MALRMKNSFSSSIGAVISSKSARSPSPRMNWRSCARIAVRRTQRLGSFAQRRTSGSAPGSRPITSEIGSVASQSTCAQAAV
jgi:hypothetical protein